MSFSDIKDQSFAVTLLKQAIENNRLASTYMFYGPEGIGKELTTKQFIKALNCEELVGDSCDRCSSCIRINKNEYPDIHWLYPVGASRRIKIEQVRQLQQKMSWKAYEGKVKIGIIIDADTLTQEAGNALLKTLEEPSPGSVFILITSSPESVLPTITSRAQEIQFFSLPKATVSKLLEEKEGFSKKEAELYSNLSTGSVGKVLELRNEDVYSRRKMILDILAKGIFKGMAELMDKVQEIIDNLKQFKDNLLAKFKKEGHSKIKGLEREAYVAGKYRGQVEEILNLILSWYRDILVFQTTLKSEWIINKDYIDSIKSWKDKISLNELEKKLKVVEDIKEGLARNVSLKLLFQVMFIQLGLI